MKRETTVMVLRVGKAAHRVSTIEEASALYARLRDASGLGSSDWPEGSVGAYTISYNAKVWLGYALVFDPYEESGRQWSRGYEHLTPSMCDPMNDPSSLLQGGGV